MEPLKRHTGLVAVLNRVNIDTDQIIPKQFLKRIERTGLGQFAFFDWCYNLDGTLNPSFELNYPNAQGASILVAGDNFGCGSSREHTPWALLDYGFKVLIAPSFADIFRSNCFQNSILTITPARPVVDDLMQHVSNGKYILTVDLEACTLSGANGFQAGFEIDLIRRKCLLQGLDDTGLTLQLEDKIADYKARRPAWRARSIR